VKKLSQYLNVGEPVLPRKRKVPRRLDDGHGNNSFSLGQLRIDIFEGLDLVIEAVKDCFDQPGFW